MTDAQWGHGMALKPHGARRLTMLAWDALKGSQLFIDLNARFRQDECRAGGA